MLEGRTVLGIITARGGSKGLPGKNIRPLRGQPLIGWTIAAAQASTLIDELVLSTDSEEIAELARARGVSVPFLRPAELASDTASSVDVIEHALDCYRQAGREFDYLVLLEPTSPLREAVDIDAALSLMHGSGAPAVVSVCRAESTHPAFMFRKNAAQQLQTWTGEAFRVLRRQELEEAYFLCGTVYASRCDSLLASRTFCQAEAVGYEIEKWKSPEIDDIVDFLHIEAIMQQRNIGTPESRHE